jgi:hypothetical protein
MKWIESLGGPLVLLPTNKMQLWLGNAGPSKPEESHYELACDIKGFCGTLTINDIQAFVVADESNPTTWIPNSEGGQLIRWMAANSEEQLMSTAKTIMEKQHLDSVVYFDSTQGEHHLFDSVHSGTENHESIKVELKSNKSEIRTYFAKKETVWLVVHDFKKC